MAVIKRGRKPLKKGENLVPVRVFVKEKFVTRARIECAAVAAKYK